MQITFHIGANGTDADMLVKSLVRNGPALLDTGVRIPGPGKYRRLLRETIQTLAGDAPPPGTRDAVLGAILDGDLSAERLVMSNSAYICLPIRVFETAAFYGLVAMKIRALTLLFPDDTLDLHFALRNPATFIPAIWDQVRNRSFDQFMAGFDPRALRWMDVIERIRATAPRAGLTVWCNEDTPLIWGDILRRMTGVPDTQRIEGEFDLLASIMSGDGLKRFERYRETHPPQSALQTRRVIAAFLDKYALHDEVVEDIDLPGWDAALVDDLTRSYEAEVARIARMPGVTFLEP